MRFLQVVMVMCLAGCAAGHDTETLSQDDMQALTRMNVFKGEPSRPYTALGKVFGTSCHAGDAFATTGTDPATILNMEAMAARGGADAVINYECHRGYRPTWFGICSDSLVCSGTAIRYQK